MLFDFNEIPGKECYKLLVSTVTPRPIAWVVSQDANGLAERGSILVLQRVLGQSSGRGHWNWPATTRAGRRIVA